MSVSVATPVAKRDELRLLLNSHQPIITVETGEEERLESLLADVALEMDVPFFRWSVTAGLARLHGEPIYNTDNPEAALSNMALIASDGISTPPESASWRAIWKASHHRGGGRPCGGANIRRLT